MLYIYIIQFNNMCVCVYMNEYAACETPLLYVLQYFYSLCVHISDVVVVVVVVSNISCTHIHISKQASKHSLKIILGRFILMIVKRKKQISQCDVY